jgi:hypothetical protein
MASVSSIADGVKAAEIAMKGRKKTELAILVSCVGRKLMMNQSRRRS